MKVFIFLYIFYIYSLPLRAQRVNGGGPERHQGGGAGTVFLMLPGWGAHFILEYYNMMAACNFFLLLL